MSNKFLAHSNTKLSYFLEHFIWVDFNIQLVIWTISDLANSILLNLL
jgi:hypothetical protein